MKRISTVVAFILFAYCAMAQGDTTITYTNWDGKTIPKDSAIIYVKMFKKDGKWFGRNYFVEKNQLYSEGNYEGPNPEKRLGSFTQYNAKGKVESVSVYGADNKLVEMNGVSRTEKRNFT